MQAALTVIGRRNEGAGRVDLRRANIRGARLFEAHLEGAYLREAHLEGVDLSGAEGLKPAQLDQAFGDAETTLPVGVTRPAAWPTAAPQ